MIESMWVKILILHGWLLLYGLAPAAGAEGGCQSRLQAVVGAAAEAPALRRAHRGLGDELVNLYQASGWGPLWWRGGEPTPQAMVLMQRLITAERKGLDATDYEAHRWSKRLSHGASASPGECADWSDDVALSQNALRYVSDLRLGRVDPRNLGFDLDLAPKRRGFAGLLARLAEAAEPAAVLDGLEPPFRRYRELLATLPQYLELARDPRLALPLPEPERSVRPGDPYPALGSLAFRLARLGDLDADLVADDGKGGVYAGGALVEAVIRFQGRHGLAQDGIIGAKTFAALNTPPADRLRQIGLTLERWRWMPDDLGHRPLVINVPEFRLYAFEPAPDGGYRLALNMDVIVGKSFPRFQTPVFRGDMSYLVFSPFWNVPESIQRRELAPRIAEDPAYLADNHFQIVASYALSAEPLPADSANLERVLAGELKLRQAPGPDNALGVAKFMFPNNHAVYLHGTPAMGLFSKDKRDFSHGCIRIADPPRLAAYVLSQEPGWDRARVDAVIADGERRAVSLSRALAVFVLYGTAVVEPNGPVRFFQDIYGHDRRLEKALALKR